MDRTSIWVVTILVLLILPMANTIQENLKLSLVAFMNKLSSGTASRHPNWGWNMSSDPCIDKWIGVNCTDSQQVRKIVLEGLNLNGTLDAASICTATSLQVLSLKNNKIVGLMPQEIGSCKRLTHIFVSGNQFSGAIPGSISQLINLKRLDISNNSFSGQLPDMSRISGLLSFFAQDNQLSGPIPNLDFVNLVSLNVSNNNFVGPIPDVQGKFNADSFLGNPGLCGKPLQNVCPPSRAPILPPPLLQPKSKRSSRDKIITYLGYALLVLVVLLFFAFKIVSKYKRKKERNDDAARKSSGRESKSTGNTITTTADSRTTVDRQENRSEFSITSSAVSGLTSSPLVLLTSSMVKNMKLEELLRAPAELLSRGKHGSLYKVILGDGLVLAVKRIKGWDISSEEFKSRMQKIDQVKHPNILAPVALYCSEQEKLLVYQYQPNGSLFSLLHGQNGNVFDWGSRLRVAAIVAKALAFMHHELREDGIAHGNLKCTNVLFDDNMEPCISEYGLMVTQVQHQSILSQTDNPRNDDLRESSIHDKTFTVDVYGFGVILLELLTGKFVQNNTDDLATWVQSVVSEEWTAEVLDKSLISEGVNEERMINLLQLALRCLNPSPNHRPSMNQILMIIHRIMVEEETSNISDP